MNIMNQSLKILLTYFLCPPPPATKIGGGGSYRFALVGPYFRPSHSVKLNVKVNFTCLVRK